MSLCLFCVHRAAPECEWSGDEKKAGGTHRGPTPGPWTAPTQHLLPLLVWLLQVSLVRNYYTILCCAVLCRAVPYYTVLYCTILFYTIL